MGDRPSIPLQTDHNCYLFIIHLKELICLLIILSKIKWWAVWSIDLLMILIEGRESITILTTLIGIWLILLACNQQVMLTFPYRCKKSKNDKTFVIDVIMLLTMTKVEATALFCNSRPKHYSPWCANDDTDIYSDIYRNIHIVWIQKPRDPIIFAGMSFSLSEVYFGRKGWFMDVPVQ